MSICIYTVHLFLYECITCKIKYCLSNYCTFLMLPKKYKITSIKKIIIGGHPVALVGQAKDFHQRHIWCFPLPCTGEKSPWKPHASPARISCDVLTCSIHGIQQRHLILWSMIISFPPPFSNNCSDCAVGNLHIMYMLPNLIGYSKWLNGWFKLYFS